MSKIYRSQSELIGNTPLYEASGIKKHYGFDARLLLKLEMFNPAGSVKDRVAMHMIDVAEKSGKLHEGSVIIEPTSGNTGIGIAAVAAARGYRVIIVMPDSMSAERQKLVTAYGAELVLTEGRYGMQGAIAKAEQLKDEIRGSIIAGQFTNPANPDAHYSTTGPEIWRDTDGIIDYFVVGVGTGGTITGVGRYLKQQNGNIRIVAVEPLGSPVLSGGAAGKHGLQGIGAGFVPDVLDTSVYDEVIAVSEAEAYDAARAVARCEGLLVGISSGAALSAAVKIAMMPQNRGKSIVALMPDTGDRYLSTDLFDTQ